MADLSPPDLTKIKRVLIVKLSAMGDILHALPVASALKASFPHLEIGWAVQTNFALLLEGNPSLTRIHEVPPLRVNHLNRRDYRRDYPASLREIRQCRYDLVLDLQGLTKSALVAVWSGASLRYGYHWLRELARIVENPIPKRSQSVHVVDQYLDTAHFFGAAVRPVTFPFAISDTDSAHVKSLLREGGIREGDRFLSVNPASAQPLKQWGESHFAGVMDRIYEKTGTPCVLLTSDKAVAGEVAAAAQHPFVDLSGKTTLKQLGGVIAESRVHLCGDTGSAHLAAALGVSTITLVGPTDPDRICPYGQRANVFSHKEVCDPACNWHHCAFPHAKCLAAITEGEVVERILGLIEGE